MQYDDTFAVAVIAISYTCSHWANERRERYRSTGSWELGAARTSTVLNNVRAISVSSKQTDPRVKIFAVQNFAADIAGVFSLCRG